MGVASVCAKGASLNSFYSCAVAHWDSAMAVSFKTTYVCHFGDNNRSSQTTSRQEKLPPWKTSKHSRNGTPHRFVKPNAGKSKANRRTCRHPWCAHVLKS